MLRSMYSGISGMKNFQTKLDVIGNNIANVNTYGFKKGRVTFKDTMNQTISGASAAQDNRGGKNPLQVGLGSTLATIDTIHTQSSLQTTGRSLDLAINGDGYFVMKQGGQQTYSRAGNFYLDDSGTLVNGDGLKVQAFKMNADGTVGNAYGDVSVNVNAVLPTIETKNISFTNNLSDNISQQVKLVSSDGKEVVGKVNFVNSTGTDSWDVQLNGKSVGTLDFSTVTQTNPEPVWNETTTTPSPWPITVDGEPIPRINFDFSDVSQNKNEPTTIIGDPDGNTQGSLESFNIGAGGEINGVFSNGLVETLGVLALAKFSNPSGLSKAGGNVFQESINSGVANIDLPGNGRGSLASGSLEMSNVDLSEEFTEMITAQRGFQANTRIITTSDEILQELVNLKR
ncbi:flagellar hook protein FlgE [Bacillus sp. AK031]